MSLPTEPSLPGGRRSVRPVRWGETGWVGPALLLVLAALGGVGCGKSERLVGEYSSVGTGRPDGGWTVRLFASGTCEVLGTVPGRGTYQTNQAGCVLETRVQTGWRGLFTRPIKGTTSLVSVRTNGFEYLVDGSVHRQFARSGDTNLLRFELRRVR